MKIMQTRKIFTIGDFVTLTGSEIMDIPLITPKIENTRGVLEKFEQRLKAREKGLYSSRRHNYILGYFLCISKLRFRWT